MSAGFSAVESTKTMPQSILGTSLPGLVQRGGDSAFKRRATWPLLPKTILPRCHVIFNASGTLDLARSSRDSRLDHASGLA